MQSLHFIQIDINGEKQQFEWRSENGSKLPEKIIYIDDTFSADQAYKLASSGCSLLWRGDFQNARQLLQAMSRRFEKNRAHKLLKSKKLLSSKPVKTRAVGENSSPKTVLNPNPTALAEIKNEYQEFRISQKVKAEILGRLLISVQSNHLIDLKRAPNVLSACGQAYGADAAPYIISLRELLGVISAYEWRKKGVYIDMTERGIKPFKIHPHFGVFSPIRGEYLGLLAEAPLPQALAQDSIAFDIGTGTGVLSILLAKRGVRQIIATDQSKRAVICAESNVADLGLNKNILVSHADLFPDGKKASLIVCNPPWLPAATSASVDSAVFDPNSQMLLGFLQGLPSHLLPGAQGWLIMSNFAELLGLREEGELLGWIAKAGLVVIDRQDVRPLHRKTSDSFDPFYAARSRELTTLWRLGLQD